jgi:hypothetical protein
MEILRGARRLPRRDLALTAVALGVLAAVELGLRVARLPSLSAALGVPLLTTPESPSHWVDGDQLPMWARRRLAATRRATRRWPFGDTCLREALVAGCLIRRLDPSLRIGVAKVDGQVKAHAWIEIQGRALDPGALSFATVHTVAGP